MGWLIDEKRLESILKQRSDRTPAMRKGLRILSKNALGVKSVSLENEES